MASRPPPRSSSLPLRTVLIGAVVFLAVLLVVVIAYKKGKAEAPPDIAAKTAPVDNTANPRADMALLRAHRAQAVDAIETGDYDSAVKTLTEIVRSGRGVGDEPELLRIAKDLQEKHAQNQRASPPAAVAMKEPAPAPKEPAPAPKEPPKEAKAEPKEPPPSREKEKKPDPKHTAKAAKPPPREERKVASAKPVPVIPDREPESGQVLVMSVPSGLTAEVDGTAAGSTPTRYTTAPGVHTVTLYKGSQKVAERTVTVSENAVATADFDIRDQLQPTPVSLKEREPEKEKEAPPPPSEEKQAEKVARTEPSPPPLPSTTPAAAVAGMGEVMVPPMSLAGDVFINGKSYGPPPVLAREIPAGNATVELRVGDAVKRSKVVPVEAHQRATVKFR